MKKIKHCLYRPNRPQRLQEFEAPRIFRQLPLERRKRGHPRKTSIEGVQAAMITRNLKLDQWRNRQEWHLVSRRL
jgi:hypothetical protein